MEKGEGILVTARRPADRQPADKFVPCEYCMGFYHVEYLATHGKSCAFRGGASIENKAYVRNGRTILAPFLHANNTATELDVLLQGMRETKKNPGIVPICLGDALIRMFAQSKCDRLGTTDEQRRRDLDTIRTKVRSLGRLLKQLNIGGGVWKDLNYFLHPAHFNDVWKGVRKLGEESGSPQLAITLGHYVKQVILLKRSLGVQTGDESKVKEARDFLYLYDAEWNNKVTAVNVRRQRLRHLNKEVQLPSTQDLMTLTDYVVKRIKAYVSGEELLIWSDLARLIMVRLLLFNKRRAAEVQELKKTDIPDTPGTSMRAKVHKEIMDSLDVTERALAQRLVSVCFCMYKKHQEYRYKKQRF